MNAQTVTALPTLPRLLEDLRTAKAMENEAKELRLAAEEAILAHPAVKAAVKDEGTVTVEGVKVSTGFTRSWDQEALAGLAAEISPEYFPFRPEYAEDRKASRVMEERFPDLWARLRTALTLKPKKPSLALVD